MGTPAVSDVGYVAWDTGSGVVDDTGLVGWTVGQAVVADVGVAALEPPSSSGTTATAGLATVTVVALDTTVAVEPNAGLPATSVVAFGGTAVVEPTAALGVVTATALAPAPLVEPTAGLGAVAVDALSPSPLVEPQAGLAAVQVITAVNQVYYWGQFRGTGPTVDTPTLMPPVPDGGAIVQLSCSNSATYVLTSLGNVYATGDGTNGALGNGSGSGTSYGAWVQVGAGVSGFQGEIASLARLGSGNGMAAIDSAGNPWFWGYNAGGEFGLGNTTQQNSPVMSTNWGTLKMLCGSAAHYVGVTTDNRILTAGDNNHGCLGNNASGTPSTTPVDITSRINGGTISNVLMVGTSWGNAGVLITTSPGATSGQLWVWGYGGSAAAGMLGNGTGGVDSAVPIQVTNANSTPWTYFAYGGDSASAGACLALDNANQMWSWGGIGNPGCLGAGLGTETSPTQSGPPGQSTFVVAQLATTGHVSFVVPSQAVGSGGATALPAYNIAGCGTNTNGSLGWGQSSNPTRFNKWNGSSDGLTDTQTFAPEVQPFIPASVDTISGVASNAAALTGAAAQAAVQATTGLGIVTVDAFNVSTSNGTVATAGLAAVSVVAFGASPAVEPSAGLAAAQAVALAPSVAVSFTAGLATVVAVAFAPTPAVAISAGLALVSATALAPTPVITAAAGLATVTITAYNAFVPAGNPPVVYLMAQPGARLLQAPASTRSLNALPGTRDVEAPPE